LDKNDFSTFYADIAIKKRGGSPLQCSIRVKNSFEKGVKFHFSVKNAQKYHLEILLLATTTKLSGLCRGLKCEMADQAFSPGLHTSHG